VVAVCLVLAVILLVLTLGRPVKMPAAVRRSELP